VTEPLHIEVVAEGGDTRLALVGELTYATVPLFTVEVTETVGPSRSRLLLDVARLHFCDSVGLSALIGAQRRAQRAGGAVVLFGVHGCLQRSLTVTGTDALFTLVGSAERNETATVKSATGRTGETA
jgi:anti-sigma B factor antagonist